MRDTEGNLQRLSSALQSAPYKPGEWMHALERLANATNSQHAELVFWLKPNKTPFKLISNLFDTQAKLIEQWDARTDADPVIERGIRTPVLHTVCDTEFVSKEVRKRHPLWTQFYDPMDMPHFCATPLQRDSDAMLGLFLLRSRRDGPVRRDERRLFARMAYAWRDAAQAALALGKDATLILAGALEGVSATAIVLDGTSCAAYLTPGAEALVNEQSSLVIRSGRLQLAEATSAQAQCRRASRMIEIDAGLEPCISCMIKQHHRRGESGKMPCSISVTRADASPITLHLSPLPRQQHAICFDAALLIAIGVQGHRAASARLRSDLAALLTPTEREVALEILNGERPAQISSRRGVTTETIRCHIKRIFAKAEVPGAVEFIARARL
jgi:DNA-binding CsgD family transcriptional regulator